jgi:ABC-type nitrate/sulfonate/bicarbonate transport system ATPase subunit
MAEFVSLTHVSKSFESRQGRLPVLDDIQLHIRSGEIVAVLGPSGCGKSTLLRMIAGLDHPSAGTVTLGGQVVRDVDPRCAVVFQEPRLFPWKTVAANVAVGARRVATAPQPDSLLHLVGLADFDDSYPHQLSGGMAQRAALARALIGRPEVLLMDEPFAALDAFTRMQMQDLLISAWHAFEPTVVLVTHDVDEALFLADRIIIMSSRPSRVAATLDVNVPRPRDRGDVALAPLRAKILAHFGFSHAVSSNTADTYAI